MQSLNTFNIKAGDGEEKCSLLFPTNIFHITEPCLENITAEMNTLCLSFVDIDIDINTTLARGEERSTQ